jgi:hypothetical protein
MSRYSEFDPDCLDVRPFAEIKHTVHSDTFASAPSSNASFADFWSSLPRIYAGSAIRTAAARIALAKQKKRGIIAACGAHVIKCGLAPVLISLMREGFLTTLAVNGATAIHDIEIAMFGSTSEVVAEGLSHGSFGMARETAEFINKAFEAAVSNNEGAGEALGRALNEQDAPNNHLSVLASAYSMGIPVTVHVAVGTDVVHMHKSAQGGAIGETSLRDFRILTSAMRTLSNGGVLLNIGSAVLLPEVLLKSMASLRNIDSNFTGFLGVNMDMIQQYRSNEQVVTRVKAIGGDGLSLTGHHEIMVPLLAFAILEEWRMLSGPSQEEDGLVV